MKRQNEIAKRKFDFPSFGSKFPSFFESKLFDSSFDDMIKGFFTESKFPMPALLGESSMLPCDVKIVNDKDGNLEKTIIEYAAAGYEEKDIAVTVDDQDESLHINISKEVNEEDKNVKFLQKRISKRSFSASYSLTDVDTKNIVVKFEKGIVSIELPHKKQNTPKGERLLPVNQHLLATIAAKKEKDEDLGMYRG